MTDLLRLVSGLAVYNGQYDGFVIGRGRWWISGTVSAMKCRIRTKRDGYSVIEVTGYTAEGIVAGKLAVTLFRMTSGLGIKKSEEKGNGLRGFRFSQRQVDVYLEKVCDANPVHRGKNAIVPGLMLLDFVCEHSGPKKAQTSGSIRFRQPMYVGSPFVLLTEKEKYCIVSPQGDICYAEIKKE